MINNNIIQTILSLLLNLIDVLAIILPVLLAVAFMTIIERKKCLLFLRLNIVVVQVVYHILVKSKCFVFF